MFLDDVYKYLLICEVYWGRDEKKFKITLTSEAIMSESELLMEEENLSYKQV